MHLQLSCIEHGTSNARVLGQSPSGCTIDLILDKNLFCIIVHINHIQRVILVKLSIGLFVQWPKALPCHGRYHGFKSHTDRYSSIILRCKIGFVTRFGNVRAKSGLFLDHMKRRVLLVMARRKTNRFTKFQSLVNNR